MEYALGNTTTKRFKTCCRVTNLLPNIVKHFYTFQYNFFQDMNIYISSVKLNKCQKMFENVFKIKKYLVSDPIQSCLALSFMKKKGILKNCCLLS